MARAAVWRTYTVGELAQIFDGPHATPVKFHSGPWFLSISSLDGGRLRLEESSHISAEDYKRWTRRVTPQEGDVLFSYETRLGEAALMPAGIEACLGRRMGLLRPKRGKVSPRFLLYNFLGPDFQRVIFERSVHGATVDRIPLSELGEWPMKAPALVEQEAIAEMLGALDEKIAINEQIQETALSLARARVEREIVATGRLVSVSDIAEIAYGKAMPVPQRQPGEVPVFGCTGRVGWHNEATTKSPCPVIGRKGANAGHVSWMPRPGWVIDTAFSSHPTRPNMGPEYLFILLESAGFRSLVGDSAVPGLNRHVALQHKVPVPSESADSRLSAEVRQLFAMTDSLLKENRTLAELRDTLLSELVSGRMRVKDAERVVSEAEA